jgi:hypothetical protein
MYAKMKPSITSQVAKKMFFLCILLTIIVSTKIQAEEIKVITEKERESIFKKLSSSDFGKRAGTKLPYKLSDEQAWPEKKLTPEEVEFIREAKDFFNNQGRLNCFDIFYQKLGYRDGSKKITGIYLAEDKINELFSACFYNDVGAFLDFFDDSITSTYKDASKKYKKNDEKYTKNWKDKLEEFKQYVGVIRQRASNNTISKALNYSAGLKEDSSAEAFYYPIDENKDSCKFSFFHSQNLNPALSSFLRIYPDLIDLNTIDYKNVKFYEIRKKNEATLIYQTKADSLPDIFRCDSNVCNLERLGRAWNLIEKKCPGIKREF